MGEVEAVDEAGPSRSCGKTEGADDEADRYAAAVVLPCTKGRKLLN